jgi:hypothetical protein
LTHYSKDAYVLTKKAYSRCFTPLDERARTKHNCFVSEFFISEKHVAFTVCFRPLGRTPKDTNRADCKYLQFAVGEIKAMVLVNSIAKKRPVLETMSGDRPGCWQWSE